MADDFFTGDQYNYAQDFRVDHGYDQLIDPYDTSYLESAGLDFSGIVFSNGMTEVVYYSQFDARWKDLPYGLSDTIGKSGCGPTSLAITA